MSNDCEKRGGEIYRAVAETELDKRLKAFMERLDGDPNDTAAANVQEHNESDGETNIERYRNLRLRSPSFNGKADDKSRGAGNIHAGHRKRLRASALRDRELAGFGETDLLELLLSFVVPQKDVNPTAHALLDKFGSVAAVLDAPPDALAETDGMTGDAAAILPIVGRMSMLRGRNEIKLARPVDAADLFGCMFIGGAKNGIYAAYLDERFALISVERYEKTTTPVREIIGSVVKYGARNVIVVRRDRGLFPDAFGLTRAVARLAVALEATDTRLTDYIMFTDYGYYTLGKPPQTAGEWYPQYVFVPEKLYSRAPRAVELARSAIDDERGEK